MGGNKGEGGEVKTLPFYHDQSCFLTDVFFSCNLTNFQVWTTFDEWLTLNTFLIKVAYIYLLVLSKNFSFPGKAIW